MSVRIRINKEFSGKLEDYCENAGGMEFICVFKHPSWYIFARPADLQRVRNPWRYVTHCGSWANYVYKWKLYVGVYKTYEHRNYDGLEREKALFEGARS